MKQVSKILYIVLIVILAAVFIYCGWSLWSYYAEGAKTQEGYNQLSDLRAEGQATVDIPKQEGQSQIDWEYLLSQDDFTMPESPYVIVENPNTGERVTMLAEFEELYKINPDIVGWISIEDTNIDYPVVQRKDQTDYYLYRDFYGNQVMRGCLYVREQCDVLMPSDNVIIYGHRMQDDTMFAQLGEYERKSFWQEHQYIRFDTLEANHVYQIVCVFKTTATMGEGFQYHLFVDAADEDAFNRFWEACQANALYDTGIPVSYGDKLISLSTCEYSQENGRLVVVAKRLS